MLFHLAVLCQQKRGRGGGTMARSGVACSVSRTCEVLMVPGGIRLDTELRSSGDILLSGRLVCAVFRLGKLRTGRRTDGIGMEGGGGEWDGGGGGGGIRCRNRKWVINKGRVGMATHPFHGVPQYVNCGVVGMDI